MCVSVCELFYNIPKAESYSKYFILMLCMYKYY